MHNEAYQLQHTGFLECKISNVFSKVKLLFAVFIGFGPSFQKIQSLPKLTKGFLRNFAQKVKKVVFFVKVYTMTMFDIV